MAPVIAAALALSILPPPPALAATDVTAFALDSSIGEPVLGGRTLVFTPDNATVYAQPWGGGVEMGVSSPDHWFSAELTPPEGQTLSPGTYPTTEVPSGTTAGLDVSGDGVGCSSSTGTVTVHEISLQTEPEPHVERFAATYEFSCYGTSPLLFGELRYHSTFDFRAATSDPVGLDFESQLLGATTSPAPVTVTNRGTLDLHLGSPTFSGGAAAEFGVSGDTCSNVTLTPGASCAVGITFTPVEKYTRNAVMHLPDDTNRGHRDVRLTGFGFANPTTVGLKVSPSKIHFGEDVLVTAHLGSFGKSTTKELSIYAKPYGGTFRLIATGVVDGDGNLSASVTPKKKTTFVAKFLGDDVFSLSTSPKKTVPVSVIVDGALRRYDGTSGNYKLYRYTSRCPSSGGGCPTYAADVVPNHHGDPLCFTLQLRLGGSWRTAISCLRLRLSRMSTATAVFVYGSRRVIGIPTRVRATFRGDGDHQEDSSAWAYFKVTA
jgi:hypothetical protein